MKASVTPVRVVRRVSPFAVGFTLAAVGVAALAVMAVTPEGPLGPGGWGFAALLAVVAVLTAALGVIAALRAMRQLSGRRLGGATAPRLQMRFIALFAVAAVVPAVLMAGFHALVLNRGVEFWFGERVDTLVEAAADVGRQWPSVVLSDTTERLRDVARDLSAPEAVRGLEAERIVYRNYLTQQAQLRNLHALYVIDSQATVLARSDEAPNTPPFIAPSETMFAFADEGDIGVSDPIQLEGYGDHVRLLWRMPEYPDAYLYSLTFVDFVGVLIAADQATQAFRDAAAREQQMRERFFMVFALAALLVFIGAVWLALSAAEQVVAPVSRLVSAAERVRRGDLEARVDLSRGSDEITALGRAFNRMTRQLSGQRRALLQSNAESERRRAFIEAVLTGVSAGVVGLDASGRVTLVNRSAAALLECEPEDLVGRPLETVASNFVPVVQEAQRRPGDIAQRQVDITASDGAMVHLNVRAAHDEDGGVVVTFDDVSRLVAAQRNAAWRDVARRIAHEIKNPLTPIQLSAERLRRKYRSQVDEAALDTFDRCIETIVRQVSDIGRMVDEFSSFARMPAPQMGPAELREIAQGAVFAQRVASPDIQVSLEQQAAAPVECDARLVSQALANILKNAAESVSARTEADASKEPGQIAVRVYESGQTGFIEVCDNGLGWPMPDRERLTEPYMTTRAKGTGLGLAIVRRVMEDHGGRLELDVRPGDDRGAIVRLAFPLLETSESAGDPPAHAEA